MAPVISDYKMAELGLGHLPAGDSVILCSCAVANYSSPCLDSATL